MDPTPFENLRQLSLFALAHELNNPAAAAQHAAVHLRDSIREIESLAMELNGDFSAEHWRRLIEAERETLELSRAVLPLDAGAQRDREDEMTAWLENQGVENARQLAPVLVNAGLESFRLQELQAAFPPPAFSAVLAWLAAKLTLDASVNGVENSIARIACLVKAAQSHCHLDPSPMREIDIHDGLDSALALLKHKLKGTGLTRKFDRRLPRLHAHESELNQVWTNLIDNAIGAAGPQGKISLATFLQGDQIVVEIADNGPGIPPDIQPGIFKPFFTTKTAGAGSGLGLAISHRIIADRHGGQIEFESAPGETRFKVRLPLRARA